LTVWLGFCLPAGIVVELCTERQRLVVLTPGYPVTPFAFLIRVGLMLVLVAVHSPRGALLGVLVVLAGLPVYEIFRRRLAVATAEERGD
jgi:hypothetical protein